MTDTLRTKVSDAYARGKSRAGVAVETSKAKAGKAAKATQQSAKRAQQATADGVDRNPLIAVAGGLAIGAIVAALLPRTKREDALVGKVGQTVRSKATEAASAARTSAKGTLDALGVNADAARDQLRDLASKIGEAATNAGKSAATTIKK